MGLIDTTSPKGLPDLNRRIENSSVKAANFSKEAKAFAGSGLYVYEDNGLDGLSFFCVWGHLSWVIDAWTVAEAFSNCLFKGADWNIIADTRP